MLLQRAPIPPVQHTANEPIAQDLPGSRIRRQIVLRVEMHRPRVRLPRPQADEAGLFSLLAHDHLIGIVGTTGELTAPAFVVGLPFSIPVSLSIRAEGSVSTEIVGAEGDGPGVGGGSIFSPGGAVIRYRPCYGEAFPWIPVRGRSLQLNGEDWGAGTGNRGLVSG